MIDFVTTYWPRILAILSIALGAAAAIHAAMTKEEVRAATGWVAVILLSPIVGALLYAVAGINRIRRASLSSQRNMLSRHEGLGGLVDFEADAAALGNQHGPRFASMKILGDRVARRALTSSNTIRMLEDGDAAYAEMKRVIDAATRSILLETYIFDRDPIGLRIADALIAAVRRGITVRVLIDAVGARYSVPSIMGYLKDGGVTVDVFNGNVIIGLRLPYANLRTHRKILLVDGRIALTGGMNIRQGFTREFAGDNCAHDTHFKVTGPAVADLFHIASEDWRFATGEILDGDPWAIAEQERPAGEPVLMRIVASGPDRSLETNHMMLIGAFSVARSSIRIMSPYFLPDRELISALITAARRGVEVDIIVPAANNLVLVDRAMTAQFDQILKNYCRIWRAEGAFNHSKLLSIDGSWSYVGSSNLDPRSLRLNFEVDMEVIDRGFAAEIGERFEAALATAKPVHLATLRKRPFPDPPAGKDPLARITLSLATKGLATAADGAIVSGNALPEEMTVLEMHTRNESLRRSILQSIRNRKDRHAHVPSVRHERPPGTLIASYNVHKCVGSDRRFDPERILRVIQEIDADIIALQEADSRFGERTGLLDLQRLHRETGLTAVPVSGVNRAHGWHGNVVLFKEGTVRHVHQINLPGLEPRGALVAEIEMASGRSLRIIAAHFGLLRRSRAQQARMILDIMASGGNTPTILLGDLNEWRLGDKSSLSTFRSAFGAQPPSVPSFPANMPILALDRIIANRGGMISAVEVHNSPLARIASDHLPIKTMLTMEETI